MRNIHFTLLAAATLFGFAACNKSVEPVEGPQPDCNLIVNIGTEATTKAAYSDPNGLDRQINSLQIFVFDAEGKLETDYFKNYSGSNVSASASIATFRGRKTVYAIANRARLYLPKEYLLSDFESYDATQYGAAPIVSDLGENTYGPTSFNLVMSGKNEVEVLGYDPNVASSATNASTTVNIYLKRLVSLVRLGKVTVNFDNTSMEGASFTIQQIYLRNAVGKSLIGMTANSGSAAEAAVAFPIVLPSANFNNSGCWYNFGAIQDTAPAVSVDAFSLDATNVSGTATVVNRSLLTYPNAAATDSREATFSPRYTRLVIKAKVNKAGFAASDVTCWYTLTLRFPLVANRIYNIDNVNITMLGSNSDDDTVNDDPGRLTASISVTDWATGEDLNYNF